MTDLRMAEVTIDARDAGALAKFWSAALDWAIEPGASEFMAMVGGSGRPPDSLPILILKVPEDKVGKNRLHLDFRSDDLDAEVARLTGLGATVVYEKHEWGIHWFTLQDPEGNEFCVGQRDAEQSSGDDQTDAAQSSGGGQSDANEASGEHQIAANQASSGEAATG